MRVSTSLITCLGISVVLVLPARPFANEAAPAKGNTFTKVTDNDLKKILEDLGYNFDTDPLRDPKGNIVGHIHTLKFGKFAVKAQTFYGGEVIVLGYRSPTPNVPLERINQWNDAEALSRALLRGKNKDAVLEWDVDVTMGVTPAQCKHAIDRFRRQVERFEQFIQAAAGAGDQTQERPPVKSGEKVTGSAPLPAAGDDPLALVRFQNPQETEMIVWFPLNQKEKETAWKISWDVVERKNGPLPKGWPTTFKNREKSVYFVITGAWFLPDPKDGRWVQVLDRAEVSEIYVPYHDGDMRWLDVRNHSSFPELHREEAGTHGRPLKGGRGKENRVIAELRDRGIAYRHLEQTGSRSQTFVRRGEELVLWASMNAINYDYILQYGFQDDGTVTFRSTPTGINIQQRGKDRDNLAYPYMSHMHSTCWRIGVRLGREDDRAKPNTAYLVSHAIVGAHPEGRKAPRAELHGRPLAEEFNGGFEGAEDWNAAEFTRLRVENPSLTMPGNKYPASYDLVPVRYGTARHPRPYEEFTRKDFWVTRSDADVPSYIYLPEYFRKEQGEPAAPGRYKGRALEGSGLTLWTMTSVLHEPRAEDGLPQQPGGLVQGQATTIWSGFDLRPRDLFTHTPLYNLRPLR